MAQNMPVKQPFWKQIWFWALAVLVIALAIGAIATM